MDLQALKRARCDQLRGQETINQVEHVASAGARLQYTNCLVPGDVVTADASAAGVLVRGGSIVRLQVAADTYVAFGDTDTMAAVDVTTTPALKLPAGYHVVVATADFMRCSANPTRIEVVTV